jgi:hypothetical protein
VSAGSGFGLGGDKSKRRRACGWAGQHCRRACGWAGQHCRRACGWAGQHCRREVNLAPTHLPGELPGIDKGRQEEAKTQVKGAQAPQPTYTCMQPFVYCNAASTVPQTPAHSSTLRGTSSWWGVQCHKHLRRAFSVLRGASYGWGIQCALMSSTIPGRNTTSGADRSKPTSFEFQGA